MATPFNANKCPKCRLNFMTKRLLDSHVCIGFGYSTSAGKIKYREMANEQMRQDLREARGDRPHNWPDAEVFSSSPSESDNWLTRWTTEWPIGQERNKMAASAYLHQMGERSGMDVARLNELLRITNKLDWVNRVLLHYVESLGLTEEELYPECFEDEEEGNES